MKLLFFWTVTLLTVTTGSLHPWPDPTRGGSGVDLSGKMFTLSRYNGGLVIYSPYQPSPWASSTPYNPSYTQTNTGKTERYTPNTSTQTTYHTRKPTTPKPTTHKPYTTKPTTPKPTTHKPYTTKPTTTKPTTTKPTTTKPTTTKPTTTRPTTQPTTHPWTTNPSTRGVTVCLRYITDSQGGSIFSLSPSSSRLRLEFNGPLSYMLSFQDYYSVYLQPNIRLWSHLSPNMWTSICLTVDNIKGVVQMFRDSDMSSRKLLTFQYAWTGEPVIDFTNFEGQVTDVQVWDYPLSYKEVLYYMSSGYYGPYQGSALNWSYISYSVRGKTLLEDSYELQMRKPNRKRGQRHHLKGGQNPRKFFRFEESKPEQRRKEM